jgi:transposase-like protein
MTETQAYEAFMRWRWPETNGVPVCPHCEHPRVYVGRRRRIFTCAGPACRRQFSATTGTAFASRKMAFAAIMKIISEAGECSALELSRRLGCEYKTAYVAAQKQRSPNAKTWVGYWQGRRAPA